MLADEDEFLHTVAILFVPVAAQTRVLLHELLEFGLGHGGIPLSYVTDGDLLACLFEDVADILLVAEVADAFRTDDALGPFAGHEFIKESEFEGTATIIDVCADAVFLGFTLVMMMMVVLMMMLVFMLMLMMVPMLVMMFVLIVIIIVFFVVVLLHLLYPSG